MFASRAKSQTLNPDKTLNPHQVLAFDDDGVQSKIANGTLWRQMMDWAKSGSLLTIQVSEDLLDDVGILDARDDPHRPAAGRAGLDKVN